MLVGSSSDAILINQSLYTRTRKSKLFALTIDAILDLVFIVLFYLDVFLVLKSFFHYLNSYFNVAF
jgi:hypothetical protein